MFNNYYNFLAKLKPENNLQNLKNDIEQLLYSIKTIYNNLISMGLKMNTESSKAVKLHILRLNLSGKLDLNNPNKNIALANLCIYYTWKNIKSAFSNNKSKTSAPTQNGEFDLPDESYSIFDMQDYFETILLYKFM